MFVDTYGKDKKYFLITTMNLRLVEFSVIYIYSVSMYLLILMILIPRTQRNGISTSTMRLTKTIQEKLPNKASADSFSAKNTSRVRFTVTVGCTLR